MDRDFPRALRWWSLLVVAVTAAGSVRSLPADMVVLIAPRVAHC